jgi:uncharacterized protein YecT (DUF1311 family)
MTNYTNKIRNPLTIGLTIAIAFSGVNVSSIAGERNINCQNPQSNIEYKECARRDYVAADKQLNNVYQKISARLKGDEKKRLVNAQLAWIKFRDSNCDFEVYRNLGGTGYGGFLSNCLERMTKARIQELETWQNRS